MDNELFLKTATLVVGSVGATKVLYDILMGKSTRLCEEYKFAKEFLGEVALGNLHPFLREKGYQAIAGDNELHYKEV